MGALQTAERVSAVDMSDNFVFRRSLLAYLEAAKLVSGNVLEIGSGEGYGIQYLLPKSEHYTAIDKYPAKVVTETKDEKFSFIQMAVPPLQDIPDNTFDFVVNFQVIEHIKNDELFVQEINRVLKPGGKYIVSTPNIKMSLTRNPWHVREYTIEQLEALLQKDFSEVDCRGVYGNEKAMAYYEDNAKSVKKITRFDILNLQYRLPRQLLQIPYDILNRYNRRKLLKQNTGLVSQFKTDDFFIEKAKDDCFDLFYIATK